jgi:hypothetical protein
MSAISEILSQACAAITVAALCELAALGVAGGAVFVGMAVLR